MLSINRVAILTLTVTLVALAPALPRAASDTPAHGDLGPSSALSPAVRLAYAQALGELRVGETILLQTLDPDSGAAGIAVMGLGVGETLMRVAPDMRVAPWIAFQLDQLDALTWRVTLRGDVTFSDGAPVDAEAVKVSLERSLEQQPGAVSLLPTGTQFDASGYTLDIRTPSPVGPMANNLAAFNFVIKKVAPDGSLLFTGPYVPTELVERQSVTLTAYGGYRGGPARTSTISVRSILDTSTRALALQAGDVDLAYALLPSDVPRLQAGGFQVFAFPFGRTNDIILNVTRAPMDDLAVRRAIALAIDREALVAGIMDGYGSAAYGFAPDTLGLAGVVSTQYYDPAEAARTLDAAGWVSGSDGIRARGDQRLAFTLTSYTQRPELEPLTVAIRDQLRDVGMELALEVIQDVNKAAAENTFDAVTYSYNVAPFGDLSRALLSLYTPSGTNRDRYSNPRVNQLLQQYNATADPTVRVDLLEQMQVLIGQDVPVVYVLNPYQIVGASPRLQGYAPHPLDNYKIDAQLSIQ